MRLRSYHALSRPQQKVWNLVRPLVPRRSRFFFEGERTVPGQLWYAERKLLHQIVRHARPEIAFEVGTWNGGGSTLFIAHALGENAHGSLHTVELDEGRHRDAVHLYERHLPSLRARVHFHLGSSTDVYPPLLTELGRCDFVFLDGAQDPQQTTREFEMFRPYLKAGSVLAMHDWDNEKTADLRPKIERDRSLVIEHVLSAPHSVGFAVIRVTT